MARDYFRVSDKEATIQAIIKDLPDLDDGEELKNMVQKAVEANLPAAIKKLDKPETRGWLNMTQLRVPYLKGFHYFCVPADAQQEGKSPLQLMSAKDRKRVEAEGKKHIKALQDREDLAKKIRASINSCSTLKSFKERFPEFSSYLPDRISTSGALQTKELKDALRKAGFPKDRESNA